MLLLKMMDDDSGLPDHNAGKGFVLAQVAESDVAHFDRDDEGRALIKVKRKKGAPTVWRPKGHTYVLDGDKVVAGFSRG